MTELMEYKFRHGENKARLRPIARRDWEKVVGWWNDPEVKRLFDVHFVDQTFADAEKWFSRTNSPDDEKHARSFIIEVFHENNWIGVGTAEFYNERPSHKTFFKLFCSIFISRIMTKKYSYWVRVPQPGNFFSNIRHKSSSVATQNHGSL